MVLAGREPSLGWLCAVILGTYLQPLPHFCKPFGVANASCLLFWLEWVPWMNCRFVSPACGLHVVRFPFNVPDASALKVSTANGAGFSAPAQAQGKQ